MHAYTPEGIAKLRAKDKAEIARLGARVAELEGERETIAAYLEHDAPFDECAGIDLHTMAYFYSGDTDEASPEGYYKAFLDCCRAALASSQQATEGQ